MIIELEEEDLELLCKLLAEMVDSNFTDDFMIEKMDKLRKYLIRFAYGNNR